MVLFWILFLCGVEALDWNVMQSYRQEDEGSQKSDGRADDDLPKVNADNAKCGQTYEYPSLLDAPFVSIMVDAIKSDLEYLDRENKGEIQNDGSVIYNLDFYKEDGSCSKFMEEFDEDLIRSHVVARSIWKCIGENSRNQKRSANILGKKYIAEIEKQLSRNGGWHTLEYVEGSPWPLVKVVRQINTYRPSSGDYLPYFTVQKKSESKFMAGGIRNSKSPDSKKQRVVNRGI